MALDPTLLVLIAAVAGAPTPVVTTQAPDALEPAPTLDPDAAWNYAQDPYPPCSMG